MNNIKLLDCTLRDGGRLFNCAFEDNKIKKIISRLSKAHIDYLEIGFLRSESIYKYKGDSTFFNFIFNCKELLKKRETVPLLLFCDFGMFDFNLLETNDKTTIYGIRVGFTKNDFLNHWDEVKHTFEVVKSKGYKLFIQGVNSLSYSISEFAKLLSEINRIKPYSFGLVDTYGAMNIEDVDTYFDILSRNLDETIAIDFHSHNNKQMAFALAQEIIKNNKSDREIIIDASLNGLGKGAGNLNLELIANYLNDKKISNYDFDGIFDLIDEEILPLKQRFAWGYSLASFVGGIYKSHPNNLIYLTDKYRLRSKDIKNIISMIDPQTRQKYDYDNIERLYLEYSSTQIDDKKTIDELNESFKNKPILILAPGKTLETKRNVISDFIKKNKPIIISVNFISYCDNSWAFFASPKKLLSLDITMLSDRIITTSNIKDFNHRYCVSYHSLIDRRYRLFDNSTLMLLRLLTKLQVKDVYVAGFDGYSDNQNNNFMSNYNSSTSNKVCLNKDISIMLNDFIKETHNSINMSIITPTKYRINND